MEYTPFIQGNINAISSKVADYNWAGPLDINIDGAIGSTDHDQFMTWWDAGNIRADWNQDGLITSADKDAFINDFDTGAATPLPKPKSPTYTDSSGADVASGCSCARDMRQPSKGPLVSSFVSMSLFVPVWGVMRLKHCFRRRKRK